MRGRRIALGLAPHPSGAVLAYSLNKKEMAFQRLDRAGQSVGSAARIAIRHAKNLFAFKPFQDGFLLLTIGVDANSGSHFTKELVALQLDADGKVRTPAVFMPCANWPRRYRVMVHARSFHVIKSGVYEPWHVDHAVLGDKGFRRERIEGHCGGVGDETWAYAAADGAGKLYVLHRCYGGDAAGEPKAGWYVMDVAADKSVRLPVAADSDMRNFALHGGNFAVLLRNKRGYERQLFDLSAKRLERASSKGSALPAPFDRLQLITPGGHVDPKNDNVWVGQLERWDAALRLLGGPEPVGRRLDGEIAAVPVGDEIWVVYGTQRAKLHKVFLRRYRCSEVKPQESEDPPYDVWELWQQR
ncbi:MAG: hypothetical protein ACPGUV_04715 [Polyangiales bacterium]